MDRFRLYQVFVRVAERASLSAAARSLDLPQSTVSRLVRNLEDHLGVRLFERSTHRVVLTEQGMQLLELARGLIDGVEHAEASVRATQRELVGTLRINAPVVFGQQVLPPLLATFLDQHRQLELDLELNDRRIDVAEEGFDGVIRFGDLPPDLALVAHPLALARRVLVASPGYLARHGAPQTPAQLASHQVLTYRTGTGQNTLQLSDAAGATLEALVGGRFRCSNGIVMTAMFEAGIGIGEVVEFAATRALAEGTLVRILPDWQRAPLPVHFLHPPNRGLKLKLRKLIEHLRQGMAHQPGFSALA